MSFLKFNIDRTVTALTTLKKHNNKDFNMALHTDHSEWAIRENREVLATELNISLNQLVLPKQCHSVNIKKVNITDGGRGGFSFNDGIENCDALYTYDNNLALGIFHADCVPLFLYESSKELIGIIHAGHQGTLKEITLKSIQHLKEVENIDCSKLKVMIGPAISNKFLEVKEDIISQVTNKYKQHLIKLGQKTYLDIVAINHQQLLEVGIPVINTIVNSICTYENESLFYSYRRNNKCGRHLSVIIKKGDE